MQISEKVFLVTGGASGLGAATVRNLIEAGGRVVIADLNREAGEDLAAEFENAVFAQTDVSDEESVGGAIKICVERFGKLDAAISCAGIGWAEKTFGKRGAHSLEHFRRVVSVNLVGTFNVARLAAEQISQNVPDAGGERGVIVNTASIAAFDGQKGQVAYAASKGGIVGMTLAIARDLAQYGIRVVTVAPGIFHTPLVGSLPDEAVAALNRNVPFPSRLGQPAEFAAFVRHAIENPMLNGEVVRLDGALRMPYV